MTTKRTRGFRPTVLTELRRVKSHLTIMVNAWSDVPSTVWYDAGDGRGLNWQPPETRRKRSDIPASEYPENDSAQLDRLINYLLWTRIRADQLIEMTRERLAELETESK